VARDWVDIVKRIEGAYPLAIGGTSRDETIRQLLVPYANDAMEEISRDQRWSGLFSSQSIVTAQGVRDYSLPVNYMTVRRCYWTDQNGRPQPLERWDRLELQRVYGDPVSGATTNQGAPTKFTMENQTISLYPVPDNSGPNSGGYPVTVEGYTRLISIVETTCTTTAASVTMTVIPDTGYLLALGVTAPVTVSIRGSGNAQFAGSPDTLVTTATAFPNSTTATMTTPAVTAQTAAQTFFNSQNWLITNWPDVLFYRVLATMANYWGSSEDQQKYEGLFATKMQKMRDYEFDRARGEEMQGVWQVGQRAPGLRRQDNSSFYDVRGGL
jgi:hypothetical protein